MVLRRELLIATTLAVVLHGSLVLWGSNSKGFAFSQLHPSASNQQTPQPWTLSMTKVVEVTNHANSAEVVLEPAGVTSAQALETAPSQGASKPLLERVLASTFSDGFTNSKYLALEETDTPAVPAANWILPLKKGYLHEVSSIAVRVWIEQDGSIAGVELLDVRPGLLSESQMREVVDWLASTPMNPALKNGEAVASKRNLEIAFEH
ncbi:MAG: hypothetical protein U5O12_09985 [Rhodoferax sp.]|nr:hypothetical protein [Rhodoferax sp.]